MKKIISILLVLVVLFSFVSCGGKEEAKAPVAEVQAKEEVKVAEAPKAEAPAVEAADDKVVFKVSNGAEPESLDPAKIQGVPEHNIYMSLFEGLVSYNPEDASPKPGLAESWDITNDGYTYTFHLRDAVWSDGTPITANDIVYGWTRILDPATAGPYAWFPCMFLEGAQAFNSGEAGPEAVQIRALDDKTFQMDLIGPIPYVLGALSHYSFAVIPQHAVEKYGDEWIKPANFVGNGPFKLKEWTPQSRVVVERNPLYWDADVVQLDEVIFYASDDGNTNYSMYLEGEIDWATEVPSDQLDAAVMRDDYQVAPQLSVFYYIFNNERAPFDDPLVRKALFLAIDKEAIVEDVTRAGQIAAHGIVPTMVGYEGLGEPQYDPEAAAELLAEAGYPNGVGFPEFNILYNTSDSIKQISEFLQQQWKENLGINANLENQEWATYLANRNSANFDVARAGWVGDYQDPNTFLDMFITGAGMNGGRYSNPTYDMLINEAARMPDGPERYQVLLTAEDIMINEDAAILPLYYYVSQNMVDTDVWGGWYANITDYHPSKYIYKK